MGDVLRLETISKSYQTGGEAHLGIEVLAGASLNLKAGEIVGLVAPSGAGKSTLLQIAGLLENPDAGKIFIDGAAVESLDDRRVSRLRLTKIGFIYQFHHLLAEFSALENIVLPQLVAGRERTRAETRAKELLERVGLTARAHHRPARLSGGEKQRVAFCRALANGPSLLIADEPTGNLDPASAERIFAIMVELARDEGLSALVATHNRGLAQTKLDRILTLEGGRVRLHGERF